VLVHNAAALLIKPFDEITADEFERVWRVTCYGAFVVSRIVVPHMAARKAGEIIRGVCTDILEFLARVLVIQAASYGGGRAAPITDTVLPVYSGDPLVPGSRLQTRGPAGPVIGCR